MRDSLGGTVVLVIIVVFIVVALGYLAFNVNYTKAFRMKNKIISVYEDFEGECYDDGSSKSNCEKAIDKFGKEIGYYSMGVRSISCGEGFHLRGDAVKYCVKEIVVSQDDKKSSYDDGVTKKSYYRVYTRIYIDIPIINKILDFDYFHIYGDTKTFTRE